MRGIECALNVLAQSEGGMFASEALRRALRDVEPPERKLASSIVYLTLRRMGLWKHLLAKYCKKPANSLSAETVLSLLAGIAGVTELHHFEPGVLVNALVDMAKKRSGGMSREPGLINAVLHSVMEKAPDYIESLRSSPALRDQALGFGVPGWVASIWSKELGMKETKRLIRISTDQTLMSLRASAGTDRDGWISKFGWLSPSPSDVLSYGIRLESNPYPPDIPGYAEGLVTPQTESSMLAAESLLTHWRGGALLDMCVGRGVKSGHIMTQCPDAVVEGWDISSSRLKSAEREFARLGASKERFSLVCGDALTAEPETVPSAILLDAPCSGSGTWGRHPDGKWKNTPSSVGRMEAFQKLLLSRACEILPPGGVIMYCTCSVFRGENENAAADAMVSRGDMTEIPLNIRASAARRGKPYGTVILPDSPWMDGFYMVMFRKKKV
ncbi:MAG: RNA methyltransferase [Synergistaceae bacterium]|nr:RNA methyltransferase [Synergistaceae bacterium]